MGALRDLTFDAFVEHAFGPAVRPFGLEWYWDDDAPWWDPEPSVAVDYLTRLFSEADEVLAWFSDAQIAQGLNYLVNTSVSGDSGWLYDRAVPADAREACIAAIGIFFDVIFEPRCAPVLGHLSEVGGPLNTICYMWWDAFPCVALPDDPDCHRLQLATVATMARALSSSNPAIQESGLHGLGHTARRYPAAVEAAIDGFLADPVGRRPEILAYARSARCGCVL